MSERDKFYYQHQMDTGEFSFYVPAKVTEEDCKDMEAHFAIAMRQARRRIVDTVPKC